MRFTVPNLDPGRYAVVAYCRPCGDSLVGHPREGKVNTYSPFTIVASDSGVADLVARAVADVVGDQAEAVDRPESGGL